MQNNNLHQLGRRILGKELASCQKNQHEADIAEAKDWVKYQGKTTLEFSFIMLLFVYGLTFVVVNDMLLNHFPWHDIMKATSKGVKAFLSGTLLAVIVVTVFFILSFRRYRAIKTL